MNDPLQRLNAPEDLPEAWHAHHTDLQQALLQWYAKEGRHDLPWKTEDPYSIWISEIMLQQTQVSTGWIRYPRWMARFPTVQSLAAASIDEVLQEWERLGYYARAHRLHAAAQQIVDQGGAFPRDRAQRLALPGVGPSTASAIGAFAFGLREAIFDGNVGRVWARWIGDRASEADRSAAQQQRWWWSLAQHSLPTKANDVRAYTQAIMDLGATVCTPRQPACQRCPWAATCRAKALGTPEAWPVKTRSISKITEKWRWTWTVDSAGCVACEQQPPKGRWPGLWAPALLREDAPVPAQAMAQGRWDLSHRRIEWSLYRDRPSSTFAHPDRVVWTPIEAWGALPLLKIWRDWWDGLGALDRQDVRRPTPVG